MGLKLAATGNDLAIEQCLRASDPDRAREAWRELCARIAWPTIERVVKSKLGTSFAGGDQREEDVSQIACEAFAAVFRQFDAVVGGHVIQDLGAYSARAAATAFGHWLRRKYPQRANLRSEVHHVVREDPRLDRWVYGQKTDTTGTAKMNGEPPVQNAAAALLVSKPVEATSQCYGQRDPDEMLMPDALLALYAWLNGALEFDGLVSFLKVALRRDDRDETARWDDGQTAEPPAMGGDPDDEAVAKAILQAMWDELSELEADRRGVFLVFEPPGSQQDPLIDLLIQNGVADLDEIAEFVGLDFGTLIGLLQRERVELQEVAGIYGMDPKRAEGVRRGVLERLARRFEKQGLYSIFAREGPTK